MERAFWDNDTFIIVLSLWVFSSCRAVNESTSIIFLWQVDNTG